MLKLAVLLVFIGLASAGSGVFHWDRIPVAANATQCVYHSDVHILTCRGPSGIVECPVVIDVGLGDGLIDIEVFGIGRVGHGVGVGGGVGGIRYPIHPRRLDNTTYLGNSVLLGNVTYQLFLFFGEHSLVGEHITGFRVTNETCFGRLIDTVFNLSTVQHVVHIDGGVDHDVSLFGEILLGVRGLTKRWLYGYGLWGGYPYWGGYGLGLGGLGGFGLGYPYWGFGK